jgi:hypothetical protein
VWTCEKGRLKEGEGMTKKKSRIDSFDVSLGTRPGKRPAAGRLEKWNILVCSDLGFVSQKPLSVRISEWNEFMAAQAVCVSGTVENKLSKDASPLFVEYRVGSMKDFSSESIMQRLSPLSAYAMTVFVLQRLLDGGTSRVDAIAAISKARLPRQEEERVAALLEERPSGKPPAAAQRSAGPSVDRILSMIDVSPTTDAQDGRDRPSFSKGATDALFAAASGDGERPLRKNDVAGYIDECTRRLHAQVDSIQSQGFFASARASWAGLKKLCEAIGRKSELSLSVFSCPGQDIEDRLPAVLGACMEDGRAPDLIVWDYDVTFANADMDRLARLAATCEEYKTVAVAPISMDDTLFTDIDKKETALPIFEEVRFLPLKKLRTLPASRCLCLSGPALAAGGGDDGSGETAGCTGRCCWYVVTRWAEMLLSGADPFGVKEPQAPLERVFSTDRPFCVDVPAVVAAEAGAMGLTLFENIAPKAGLERAVTLFDTEQAAKSYSVFLFNLLVNRMIRLTGIGLLGLDRRKNPAETAAVLAGFVAGELAAYGAVTSQGQAVAAAGDGGTIGVDVDSDVTISGQPIRFQFSF